MKPFDLLLSRLTGVKPAKALFGERHAVACCPSHQDKHPSCDVRELSDDRVLVTCRAGCGSKDIAESVGLLLADLYPPNLRFPPAGRKGKGSSAAKQVQAGITRPEVADAAFLIFTCAKIIASGKSLTDFAMLEMAKIVGRFDPTVIDKTAKENQRIEVQS